MAAYTLFDLSYRIARELGIVTECVVTSTGTTNETYCTTELQNCFPDDYFVTGIMWVLYDFVSYDTLITALTPPYGEWARITHFESSKGKLTHGALTAATATLDRVAVSSKEYSKDVIVSNLNAVLSEIEIPRVDKATVSTEADRTEYTLPSGVLDQKIKVWVQRVDDDSNDNRWIENYDWYIEETGRSYAKTLIFRHQPPEPWDVKVEYWVPHPPLNTRTENLYENVNINRVVLDATLRCLQWKRAQKPMVDPVLETRIAEMTMKVDKIKRKHPNRKSEVKLATYGLVNNYDYVEDY